MRDAPAMRKVLVMYTVVEEDNVKAARAAEPGSEKAGGAG